MAALSTCDPGDIFQTIETLKRENIRCSVVSLSAELHVCKVITQETKGTYNVVVNQEHFREVLFLHTPPPPATSQKTEASLIRMGFPKHTAHEFPSLCVWYEVPFLHDSFTIHILGPL